MNLSASAKLPETYLIVSLVYNVNRVQTEGMSLLILVNGYQ